MAHLVTDFGAVGDAATICTASIQKAIDAAAARGGGTVIVPAGQFVTGTVWLRSNINLHLEPGATLLGAQDVNAFPLWTPAWEGVKSHAPLIAGEGLDNVSITGRGTIDGRGKMWWDLMRKLDVFRPRLIRLVDCHNVLVEGVTLTNSPSWTLNPLACDTVTIRGIIVKNPPDSPNTDGINPDSCRNVHISDCHIDVGDDCVTIKSGSEEDGRVRHQPCENITITNCTMIHGHGGVVIGSEMTGGVRNVAISNCTFVGTDRGIRLKARRGRGGAVEDLRVSNIVMDNVLCPLVINLFYGCGAWGDRKVTDQSPQPVTEGTPRFRRLRFSNISARRVRYSAAYVIGLPEMFVEDVAFSDLSIYLDPENIEAGQSAMAPGQPELCRAGFVLENVANARLCNVQIFDQLGPAVRVNNARQVALERVTSSTVEPGAPLVSLTNVMD
jgi:polygalacturonase